VQEKVCNEIFYNVIGKLYKATDLDSLVKDLTDYLTNEQQRLKEQNINHDDLTFFFYAVAAVSDHWILNKLIQNKYIPEETILLYSIEVKMFGTAEAGSTILDNTKWLLRRDDDAALILLKIYLKTLLIIEIKDTVLIQAVCSKVYPTQLSLTDPFHCKTTLNTPNNRIRFINIRSILLSTYAGYFLLSTCAWKYGTQNLKYSLLEQKRISLQNLDA